MRLTATGVTVTRGGRLALDAPDFTVASGGALLLRGPNGAGKSTLLRALATLAPLATGAVWLDDADLTADGDEFRAQIAYAGHLDAVKTALTVRANLAHWAAIYGGGGVEAALARFELDHIADLPAGYCSAGQKRRLGLARLMVADRPVWLLDEPTVSLDVHATAIFADLMRAHCAEGGLIVAATHVEIGLEAASELHLAPPEAEVTAARDPFLAGEWG